MVRSLFEDFLEDEAQYKACEEYWNQLIQEIADSLGQAGEWLQWMPRTYADGITPMEKDGNPIADARSIKLNRAFRIIQHPIIDDKVEIDSWLDTFPREYNDLPSNEMVVSLSLSDESAELTKTFLKKWMTPETTLDEMQTLMDSVFDELDSQNDS